VEDKTDREEDGRTGREREEEQIEGEEGGRIVRIVRMARIDERIDEETRWWRRGEERMERGCNVIVGRLGRSVVGIISS
jgi:hypothetical protein